MKVYLGFPVRHRWVSVGIEPADWWIGYYRGDSHHYVCPLPCIVIRWARAADLPVGALTDQPDPAP